MLKHFLYDSGEQHNILDCSPPAARRCLYLAISLYRRFMIEFLMFVPYTSTRLTHSGLELNSFIMIYTATAQVLNDDGRRVVLS